MNNDLSGARPIEILLVEDNPGDVDLTREALENAKVSNSLHVVDDGAKAMDFLYQRREYSGVPRPDIILLDLNLPKKDGRQVLAEIRGDPALAEIPVVVLTTSQADEDIFRAYRLHANCYITKPVDFTRFMQVIRAIEEFWLTVVKLPRKKTL
jgi:two-component system, chemotaxis family, response regulator Rcp1